MSHSSRTANYSTATFICYYICFAIDVPAVLNSILCMVEIGYFFKINNLYYLCFYFSCFYNYISKQKQTVFFVQLYVVIIVVFNYT